MALAAQLDELLLLLQPTAILIPWFVRFIATVDF
jgi:hypothetical protein